jgi:iron complex outermembrane receptor protein
MQKMLLKFYKAILLCCLALCLGAPPAFAAESAKLPDMSVTATRSEQDLDKVSRNVTIITRKEIEALSPLTITDVLKSVAGLTVRDYTGTGALASVDLRGFGETGALHTLVMVDGRRLNQIDLSGADFSTIPVENVERIEILRGPASVLYGDSAVGGVINIITRTGQGKPKGKLQGQYGSFNSWGLRGYGEGSIDKFGWFISARHDYTDGYRENSETRLQNITFNTNYNTDGGWGFLLDGALNRTHYSLPGSINKAQYESDRRTTDSPNDWGKRESGNVRGQVSKDWGPGGLLIADISYRGQKNESEWAGWYNTKTDTKINTFGILPKYVLNHAIGSLGNRITLGVDYYNTSMDTDNFELNGPKTESIEYEMTSIGPYFLDELSITPALLLSFGARYQKADYDITLKPVDQSSSKYDPDDDLTAWTAGLTYNFKKGSKAYARVSRTFRYPTTEEYVTYGVFNNDLTPEKGYNYELGGEWSFMPGGRLSLAFYFLQMEDEISYNQDTFINENLDDTEHKGVEASLVVPVHKLLSLFGNITYSENKFTAGPNDGKKIPLVPELKAAAGATLTLTQGFTGTVRVNYVGERYFGSDRANEFEKMESYITVDLSLNYRWNRCKFFLNANNIFGEKYATWAYASAYGYSYYPEPEQVVWGGVSVDF